ncbi:30S ribosomal protein S3 [Candidatus Woesearchaeota archaeon]|nr:30S ribosomal protein S3 [Candidatus Woesearchaeota archaeon]
MIERQFIAQKTKEYYIKKYIEEHLRGVGISQIRLKKIPLGEKIIISASKPSLIVGSKGSNIRELTRVLKTEFKLENPQIEIAEIRNIFLDANIVAQRIASSLERFGSARFKSIGHKIMENVINSGALGVEIIVSGKIPSARAKSWRFYQGYLKKCGDIAISGVLKAQAIALLKSGIVGIKVAIMPPDIVLPDRVEIVKELSLEVEEVKPTPAEEAASEERAAAASKKKAVTKKKASSPRKKKVKEEDSSADGKKSEETGAEVSTDSSAEQEQ